MTVSCVSRCLKRILLLSLFISFSAVAESERDDFDLDDDGLIEINDVQDLLAMQSSSSGSSLYGKNKGCPDSPSGVANEGCMGYELTTDLDLSGLSVRAGALRLSNATIDGNFHAIRNIKVVRSSSRTHYGALFASINNSTVKNISLDLKGTHHGLAYEVKNSVFENLDLSVQVETSGSVTAFARRLEGSTVNRVLFRVNTTGSSVELFDGSGDSVISNVLVSGTINHLKSQTDVFGSNPTYRNILMMAVILRDGQPVRSAAIFPYSQRFSHAYYVTDRTGPASTPAGSLAERSIYGVTFDQLNCQTSFSEKCATNEQLLFDGWQSADVVGADGIRTLGWDLGTASQPPGFLFNGKIIRDVDGDGVMPPLDKWPENRYIAFDSDDDGHPDRLSASCDLQCYLANDFPRLDQFVDNAAVWQDDDFDGLPESWSQRCDASCQVASGLTLDSHPQDSDNDGIKNDTDTDDNGDGVEDVDADSDGLLDIADSQELLQVQTGLNGRFWRVDRNTEDRSGCPYTVRSGVLVPECRGYELTADIDLDSYRWSWVNDTTFTAEFNGNGFAIKNLDMVLSRKTDSKFGFFGQLENSHIHNVRFVDAVAYSRNIRSGILASTAFDSLIEDIYLSAQARMASDSGALLGLVGRSTVRRIEVDVEIEGDGLVGGLIGEVGESANISQIRVAGKVSGYRPGGIIGRIYAGNKDFSINLSRSVFLGDVNGQHSAAGIINQISGYNIKLTSLFSSGSLSGSDNSAGIAHSVNGFRNNTNQAVGMMSTMASRHPVSSQNYERLGDFESGDSQLKHSYWASDIIPGNGTVENQQSASVGGFPLSALRCPVSANTQGPASTCLDGDFTLYKDWQLLKDGESDLHWNFGNDQQLPGLHINGKIVRDSDGDGVTDDQDAWPLNRAIAIDKDKDGVADEWTVVCDQQCRSQGPALDQMPDHAAASVDADQDGLPDAWASSCDLACQQNSGLTLDTHLDDADNDGLTTREDTDDNGDGQMDADANSNGLLDIRTIQQLRWISNNLKGTSLKQNLIGSGDASGCPVSLVDGRYQALCHGYELLNDLDFDVNQDGVLNRDDGSYLWSPIADGFSAEFNGNFHTIKNLSVRKSDNLGGLFGNVRSATIRNLGIAGRLTRKPSAGGLLAATISDTDVHSIFVEGVIDVDNKSTYSGKSIYSGGLVSNATNGSTINGVLSSVTILNGKSGVGGIAGRLMDSSLANSVYIGSASSENYVAGLVGSLVRSTYSRSYVTGAVSSVKLADPLSFSGGSGSESYWASDSVGLTSSNGASSENGVFGVSLAALKCATSADVSAANNPCAADNGLSGDHVLFRNWGESKVPGTDIAYWDFGSTEQTPALRFGDGVLRDSDGDGALDQLDAFKDNPAASVDKDGDGAPDKWSVSCDSTCIKNSGLNLDRFPDNGAAWKNEDFDDLPDAWAASCDAACQASSGLTLDTHLADSDNDGEPDVSDTDDDGNGRIDADADSDGLIDIDTIWKLSAIRYDANGSSLGSNTSGCPAEIYLGEYVRRCHGYELVGDIDFGTSGRSFTDRLVLNNTVFDGNGHEIRNLNSYHGLFYEVNNSIIRNVAITGDLTHSFRSGILAREATNSVIEGCFVTGSISYDQRGGIVGTLTNGSIRACVSTVAVGQRTRSTTRVAGLVGGSNSRSTNTVTASLMLGDAWVGNRDTVPALFAAGQFDVKNSYWLKTASLSDRNQNAENSVFGTTRNNLMCATAANAGPESGCIDSGVLFNGWDTVVDTKNNNQPYWSFGNNTQMPSLKVMDKHWLDSDGDGEFDSRDAFVNNPAASKDSDGDGHPDRWAFNCGQVCREQSGLTLDAFPLLAAAYLDEDFDGRPDRWAADCDTSCQDASGLILDTALADMDNDGIPDRLDRDSDGDGAEDVDADHDGLIDIATIDEFDDIRDKPFGDSQGQNDAVSGCPMIVYQGLPKRQCHGYELVNDLNFDSNNDGVFDDKDSHWNDGSGWKSIATFNSRLEGNGYRITNLVSRGASEYGSLFKNVQGATITNLIIDGPLMHLHNTYGQKGAIADFINNSELRSVFVSGRLTGFTNNGLVAGMRSSQILFSGVNVAIETPARSSAGLVSYINGDGSRVAGNYVRVTVKHTDDTDKSVDFSALADRDFGDDNILESNYVHAEVSAADDVSVHIGFGQFSDSERNSLYIASVRQNGKLTPATGSGNLSLNNSYFSYGDVLPASFRSQHGFTSAMLACAGSDTDASNTDCNTSSTATLFKGWGSITADQLDPTMPAEPVWDFGNQQQLPAIRMPVGGRWVAARDQDGDWVFDAVDDFADNAAVALDTDGDGMPDEWLSGCDTSCQQASSLTVDSDDDNDGIPDVDDLLPKLNINTALTAAKDTDGDGLPDRCDQACQALGFLEDLDDDDDQVLDIYDKYPLISIADLPDNDKDGWPDRCDDNSCASMTADPDDDNDGLPDTEDAYPNISIGNLADTDRDGRPDDCDRACAAQGMAADADDDNDGVADFKDVYPKINIGALADLDKDGAPDECDTTCTQAGMAADLDRDGDSLNNDQDVYPDINLGGLDDLDGDGAPDMCDDACVATGMAADPDIDGDGIANDQDAFVRSAAAAVDADNDGLPDAWLPGCDSSCQRYSRLRLDQWLGDRDNDGIKDGDDRQPDVDNHVPVITEGPSTLSIGVNNDEGTMGRIYVYSRNLTRYLQIEDEGNTEFTFEIRHKGALLEADDAGYRYLPSGRQILTWVVIDKAGNRSAPVEHIVNVYPRYRFSKTDSVTGEPSNAAIAVELTAIPPEYPVIVQVQGYRSADRAADVAADFSLDELHDVVIQPGNDPDNLNLSATITVPVIRDDIEEDDEDLTLRIVRLHEDVANRGYFRLQSDRRYHTLTITENNLPPQVTLLLSQNEERVDRVTIGEGRVTIRAQVDDANGEDTHRIDWDLNNLGLDVQVGTDVSFNPDLIKPGSYKVTVTVTETNTNTRLTADAELTLVVAKAGEPDSTDNPGSGSGDSGNEEPGSGDSDGGSSDNSGSSGDGGSGGGGAIVWLLLLAGLMWRFSAPLNKSVY